VYSGTHLDNQLGGVGSRLKISPKPYLARTPIISLERTALLYRSIGVIEKTWSGIGDSKE